MAIVFLDLADTLGSLTGRVRGERIELHLAVFPGVVDWLDSITQDGHRVGLIWAGPSHLSIPAVLEAAGLAHYFSNELLILDPGEIRTELYGAAVSAAGVPESECVWVASDAATRTLANDSGWRASPHRLLVEPILESQIMRFLIVTKPSRVSIEEWTNDLQSVPFVPMLVVHSLPQFVYGISTNEAALVLESRGYEVQRQGGSGEPETGRLRVLADDPSIVLATSRRSRHLRVTHPIPSTTSFPLPNAVSPRVLEYRPLTPQTARSLSELITPDLLNQYVARFASEEIFSRHVEHPGNLRAVDLALRLLEPLAPVRQYFRHNGHLLANVEAVLRGDSTDSLCISAHLDSTPGDDHIPSTDRSPGADDDASGVAGVIAIALAFHELVRSGRSALTYRFVLFNAEESGNGGSQHYVRCLKNLRRPVRGDFQLDMIGYRRNAPVPTPFEAVIFTAGNYTTMLEASRFISNAVSAALPQVAPELTLQVWDVLVATGGDSDHRSFQDGGFPAALFCEDRFSGPSPTDPDPIRNPNYHTPQDTSVDTAYAASIVRALAAAAWSLHP